MAEPFWVDGYSDTAVSTMGTPNFDLVAMLDILPSGRVLDLGAGEGRNSLLLASAGFPVHAVDISAAGMEKLSEIADRHGLPITCQTADIREFELESDYSIVMAHGVIDYLERPEWQSLVDDIKAHTDPGGINIYTCMIFNDSYPQPAEFRAAGFKTSLALGELRAAYPGWHTWRYDYYVKWDSHPGIGTHVHPVEKTVIQRPGPGPVFRPDPLTAGPDLADAAGFDPIPIGAPSELVAERLGPPPLRLAASAYGTQYGASALHDRGVHLEMWFYGHRVIYLADGVVAGKALYVTDPAGVTADE
jgi:tellurite methyltransferase